MIKPNKLTNPHNCIVYNSYKVLKYLKQRKSASYKDLLKDQIEEIGEEAIYLFILSLDFLYALDKICYIMETDMVEIQDET